MVEIVDEKAYVTVAASPAPANGLVLNGSEITGRIMIPESGALLKAGNTFAVVARRRSEVFGLVCHSLAMREVIHTAMKCAFAPPEMPILIEGETGTGKTALARMIHRVSLGPVADPERLADFVETVLSEEPRDLLPSAIFGHVRGAFTGADHARVGAIERAGGGTVFLDEIGELPLHDQTRLLRPLRARWFHRIGELRDLPVRCRFIFATNRDLRREVREGRFREDLYYRVRGLHVVLPPLRTRDEDIPLLVEHFLQQIESNPNGSKLRPADHDNAAMMAKLRKRRPLRGNLGELQQLVQLACALGTFREAIGDAERESDVVDDAAEVVATDALASLRERLVLRSIEDVSDLDALLAEIELAYLTRVTELGRTPGDWGSMLDRLGKEKEAVRKQIRRLTDRLGRRP
ncbi:MAG: sigma 54-interacting transcriptional regulator [Polyangiales bacterium]